MPDSITDNAAPASARPRWVRVLAWGLCVASWAISLGLAFYYLHEDWQTTAVGMVVFLTAVAIGWRLDRRIDPSVFRKQSAQEPPSPMP
jgi:hypothetical protein